MNDFKQAVETWIDYFHPCYYKMAKTMPVIMKGTHPMYDSQAIREYSGACIVWFYYPKDMMEPDEWLIELCKHGDLEMKITTAMQLSTLLDLKDDFIFIPNVLIVYMEKRKK